LARSTGPAKVGEIAEALIDALDGATEWSFNATAIHKPYLATAKFVDTIFDNGENLAVRPHWYIHEYLRHAICCTIDAMLTPLNRKRYWCAFLSGNRDDLKKSISNALTRSLPERPTSLCSHPGCATVRNSASRSVHPSTR
jgi:hypothetical protein